MSTLIVSNRTSGKLNRFSINNVKLDRPVSELRGQISDSINKSIEAIELVYAGRILKDDCTPLDYNIKENVCIHVLAKKITQSKPIGQLDSESLEEVVLALQKASTNPSYKDSVHEVLMEEGMIEKLFNSTPGLESDPIARAMLQTPDLLAILLDRNNIYKVLKKHPSLGQAAINVIQAVNQRSGKRQSSSTRQNYSLDAMSDEEEESEPSAQSHPGAAPPAQLITTNQLAAALAATNEASAIPSFSNQPPSSRQITEDFFQQAMRSSLANADGNQTNTSNETSESSRAGSSRRSTAFNEPGPQISEALLNQQLEQLREMGITDEAAARHALQATGGDLYAALEIMFGGDL